MHSAGTTSSGRSLAPFASYFADEPILAELIKQRVKRADRNSRELFLHRIAQRPSRSKPREEIICSLFPPRAEWHRFRPRAPARALRTAPELNRAALASAVRILRANGRAGAWSAKLDLEIEATRSQALRSSQPLASPCVLPVPKGKPHEFRPIAKFELRDKIVDVLTARYFRERFDSLFSGSCLAFRSSSGEKSAPTIHDALDRILDAAASRTAPLWVAECDIKSFFDCVCHENAIESITALQAALGPGAPPLDPRALDVLNCFLRSYSFEQSVLAKEPDLRMRHGGRARFPWPKDDLDRLRPNLGTHAVGIPQGAAISCFLANAILRSADEKLEALKRATGNFLYMRYCDDMIVIAGDEHAARAAFAVYMQALNELRLPDHAAAPLKPYLGNDRKSFWDGKSKDCYRWDRPPGGYPWIQFLGYQIRCDGLVRIRPKSLKKHKKKVFKAVENLRQRLAASRMARVTHHATVFRLRQQLLSFSVGRRPISPEPADPPRMCWAYGFRGLRGKRTVTRDLSELDRHRQAQLRRAARIVYGMANAHPEKFKAAPKNPGKSINVGSYDGCPLSYYGQFAHSQPAEPETGRASAQRSGR